MAGALVAPIGDINRAVRANGAIHRAEQLIIRLQQSPAEIGGKARALRLQFRPIDCMVQHVSENVSPGEFGGERAAMINDSTRRDVQSTVAGIRDMAKVAVSMGIVQLAMFP